MFFSQDGLAAEVGVSGGTIARLEGQRIAGILPKNFVKLAAALGKTPAELRSAIGVPEEPGSNGVLHLAVPQDVAQAAQQASRRTGKALDAWMVERLREAAERARRGGPGTPMKKAARPKEPGKE